MVSRESRIKWMLVLGCGAALATSAPYVPSLSKSAAAEIPSDVTSARVHVRIGARARAESEAGSVKVAVFGARAGSALVRATPESEVVSGGPLDGSTSRPVQPHGADAAADPEDASVTSRDEGDASAGSAGSLDPPEAGVSGNFELDLTKCPATGSCNADFRIEGLSGPRDSWDLEVEVTLRAAPNRNDDDCWGGPTYYEYSDASKLEVEIELDE